MRIALLTVWLPLMAPLQAAESTPPLVVPKEEAKAVTHPPLVEAKRLIALLPEPPPEWKGEKPQGSLTDSEAIHLSTARRLYTKGEGDEIPTAIVTIIDSASNRELFDAAPADWHTNTETDDGFDRRIEIDGMRAFEHYSKADRTGSLSVYVGGRFYVQIELTNLDPAELRYWLRRIDVKGLAALK